MHPLMNSVLRVKALEEYRQNGLRYLQHLYCKNYAVNNLMSDF